MKPLLVFSLTAGAVAALAVFGAVAGFAAPVDAPPGTPQYDGPRYDGPRYDEGGKLLFPADYRDWVFLSSGLNMSYNPDPAMAGMDMFGNTFAPRAAYDAFRKTGVWPDRTVLILENRTGATKGSINRKGQFQTGEVMGLEAHVKDTARFKGGWAFFGFGDEKPATQIPYAAACYACHQAHAAADTTFVQFYPTLLPIATRLGTLNPAYVAEGGLAPIK